MKIAELIFPTRLDYGLMRRRLAQAGQAHWAEPGTLTRPVAVAPPPAVGEAAVELHVLVFSDYLTLSDILDEMTRRGLRPAVAEEAMAFAILGAWFPNRETWVIGLGNLLSAGDSDDPYPFAPAARCRDDVWLFEPIALDPFVTDIDDDIRITCAWLAVPVAKAP